MYRQFSIEKIKNLINIGQDAKKAGQTEEELYYTNDFSLRASTFVQMGYENPDFEVGEIKEYLRIGEPVLDESGECYKPSFNFADHKYENGVSVVTTAWMHSLKSVFFGTYDEKIAKKGVYKVKGFEVPGLGGDDEILICPVDFAKKTKINTRAGLEKAVKKLGM